MNDKYLLFSIIFTIILGMIIPEISLADVEGTLGTIRDTLINRIMPLIGAMGLCFAGFSFVSGNPSARNHLYMAIVGALVAFGAPAIINFVKGLVN